MSDSRDVSSLEARREASRLNARRFEADENKKKNIVNLIGKIAVIVCIVIYMLGGNYQSLRSNVRYYNNNPGAQSFEESLADAIESGKVQAYGPNVDQFLDSQKNAGSKRSSAIGLFKMLNIGLYTAIIVCVVLAGKNIYQIVQSKKEIRKIDDAIINAGAPGKTGGERPIYMNEYTVKCPQCNASQTTGRKKCLKCGAQFKI